MAGQAQQKSVVERFFAYAKVWVTNREARDYNIHTQRTLVAAESERSWVLRYHLYHMFNMAMFMNPSNLKEETVVAYINLLAKEPSVYLRGVHFKTLSLRFGNLGPIFRNEQYRTNGIHDALKQALHVEKEGLKPFDQGTRAWRGRNVVAGYIQSIVNMFEPAPTVPSNRAERRRRAKQDRQRGGPNQ